MQASPRAALEVDAETLPSLRRRSDGAGKQYQDVRFRKFTPAAMGTGDPREQAKIIK